MDRMPYSAVPLNKGPVGTFIVLKTFFVSAREQHISGGAREQKRNFENGPEASNVHKLNYFVDFENLVDYNFGIDFDSVVGIDYFGILHFGNFENFGNFHFGQIDHFDCTGYIDHIDWRYWPVDQHHHDHRYLPFRMI